MLAATISDGSVVVAEHPHPEPGKGELLVRVRAAGLNGADIHQRAGGYPAPPGSPPDIPGLELAGEVAAVGPGVLRFDVGDRVMAVGGGGGQGGLAGGAGAARPSGRSCTSAPPCPCPTRSTGPRPAASPRSSPPLTTRSSSRQDSRWASGCS